MAVFAQSLAKRHGDDEMMAMSGTPWLDAPITLTGSREHECKLDPEQCAYQSYYWRNWYLADFAYGLSPVYFFIAVIGLFTVFRIFARLRPQSVARTSLWKKIMSVCRYVAYRTFAIPSLAWYSPSLGVIILGILGLVFFLGLGFGTRPYYWPKLSGDMSFGDSQPIATRSGWIATGIMPFLVMASMKLNLITQLTGVSHERLQVFHRWMAYTMLVFALIHTFPFIVMNIRNGEMVMNWDTSVFYWTGVVALLAQAYLTFFSFKALRDRFYEFFKATHLLAAVVFIVFFFLHCDHTLTSWSFFIATAVVYFVPFLLQQLRVFYEYGFGLKAYVTREHDGLVTVRIPVESWWKPGQHMFLRFVSPRMGIHSLTSHPFTICSLPESREAVFHIKAKGGVTKRLAEISYKHPNVPVSVWIDGPYGGMQEEQLLDYDQQLIIAGGSGAGFTLPLIEKALRQQWQPHLDNDEKSALIESIASSRINVVLVTRQAETERWYRHEISHMLSRYSAGLGKKALDVQIHLTRGMSTQSSPAHSTSDLEDIEVHAVHGKKDDIDLERTPSTGQHECIRLHQGRPDLKVLIKDITSSASGHSVGISVCGPSSMTYDVRNAAADAELATLQGKEGAKAVYLHTETFGW